MVDGLLLPDEIPELRDLIRSGLQTVLDLDEPPKFATIRREDTTTGEMVDVPGGPFRVAIDYPGTTGAANTASSPGSVQGGEVMGIEAFAPFPIEVGDRLTIAPDGNVVVVTTPAPHTEFGIVSGRIISEEGAP